MASRGKAPASRLVHSTHSTSLGPLRRQESQSQRSASSIPGSLPNQSNHATSSVPSNLQSSRPSTTMRDINLHIDSPHTQGGGNSHSGEEEPTTSVSSAASTTLPDLWVEGDHFMPKDLPATHAISALLRAKYKGFWPTLRDVPRDHKNKLFDEFKSQFNIPPQYLQAVRKRFFSKLSDRFSGSLKEARDKYYDDNTVVPDWIPKEVWSDLLVYWSGEYFHNKSQVNKANRNRTTADGRPVAKHTGGSISAHDTRTRMVCVSFF